jgi:hypothetical protein
MAARGFDSGVASNCGAGSSSHSNRKNASIDSFPKPYFDRLQRFLDDPGRGSSCGGAAAPGFIVPASKELSAPVGFKRRTVQPSRVRYVGDANGIVFNLCRTNMKSGATGTICSICLALPRTVCGPTATASFRPREWPRPLRRRDQIIAVRAARREFRQPAARRAEHSSAPFHSRSAVKTAARGCEQM